MKNDIGHFYDIEPIMDNKSFIRLLLAALASNTQIINFKDSKKKEVCLPFHFKKAMEEIIFSENGWSIDFSKFIDINTYYERQASWEDNFCRDLSSVINESSKKIEVDFLTENFNIPYTEEEIKTIYQDYDEETIQSIDHFARLIMAVQNSHRQDVIANQKLKIPFQKM